MSRSRLALLGLALAPALGQEAVTVEPATVRGLSTLPDGEPAPGVTVEVAWGEHLFDFLDAWEAAGAASMETDASGRFALRFAPPAAEVFLFRARLSGHGDVTRVWNEVSAAETIDVGEIRLVRTGSIRGHVLTWEGAATGRAGIVTASVEVPSGPLDSHPEKRRWRVPVDLGSGAFRLAELPAGPVELLASSARSGAIRREVEVRSGEEQSVELRAPPPPARSISVMARPLALGDLSPAPDSIRLVGPDGRPRTSFVAAGPPLEVIFADLDDGPYELVVDDPRFARWSRDDAAPGLLQYVPVEGCASLEVEVVDARSEAPFTEFGLRAVFEDGERREFVICPDRSIHPGGARIEGLPATRFTLIARVDGRLSGATRVELSRGEHRRVRIEVGWKLSMEGRVLAADGTPVAGHPVHWARGDIAWKDRRTPAGRVELNEGPLVTDKEGVFRSADCSHGVQELTAAFGPWLTAEGASVLTPLRPGESVTLVEPRSGWIEGRLVVPEGEDLESVRVECRAMRLKSVGSALEYDQREAELEIRADGTFRVGPLPACEVVLTSSIEVTDRDGEAVTLVERLDSVNLGVGEKRTTTYDLRERFPGSVIVTVVVDGRPPGRWLEVGFRRSDPSSNALETGDVDASGRASLALGPGEWAWFVSDREGRWTWHAPAPLKVERGSALACRAEIVLIERTVRFVDTDGAPLANRNVGWTRESGTRFGREPETDDAGHLVLVQPAGPVRFYLSGEGFTWFPPTVVEWSVGDAPLTVELSTEEF